MNPSQAEAFRALIEAAMKVHRAEAETQLELIRSKTTDKALTEAVDVIRGKLQRGIVREFAKSAANLPESLESTQPTSRSGN